MPTTSLEVSDGDSAMEEVSYDEQAPPPTSGHDSFTMKQTWVHFNVVMEKEEPAPPVLVFLVA